MNGIQSISKQNFFERFKAKEIDLVEKGLFLQEDLYELESFQESLTALQKISLLPDYLFFTFKHPKFLSTFIIPKLGFYKKQTRTVQRRKLKEINPVKNCILKASIVAAFHPKIILEIGTYLGWGAAAFKIACPRARVYTMNPKQNDKSNNPITSREIGYLYRKKNLKINQIWADSAFFDYNSIPQPDVVYIDGNHSYKYVYQDLEKCAQIVKNCIILDDFVPPGAEHQMYGPWNEAVVNATYNFVKKNEGFFKDAFHIEGSPLCILIKSR